MNNNQSNDMSTKPLQSSEYIKLTIFVFLMLPTIIFGVGLIPTILLVHSFFSAKDNNDFSRIESSVKYCCLYIFIAVALTVSVQLFLSLRQENLWPFIFLPISAGLIYYQALYRLFLEPLSKHKVWILKQSLFLGKSNMMKISDIDRTNILSPDELSKWIKLKTDGHITESEFEQIKSRLFKDL